MRRLTLILLFSCTAFAQFSDGITTSVSRIVNITPDQASFSVAVTTPLDITQQQVTQIFLDAGIQNVNVSAVSAGLPYSYPNPVTASQIGYGIDFTVAPSSLKDVARKLDDLRNSLPPLLTSLQFSAVLNASQTAVDAAHRAALPALLADARARGEQLAAAANLRLGPIASISDSVYSNGVASGLLRLGDFSTVGSFSSTSSPTTQYTFTATVRFSAL